MTIGTTGDLEMCRRAPVVEEFPKMLTRQRLTALVGLGLIGCILLGSACDVVNPEFAYQMGGNPIPGSTNVNGFVLLVLSNLTDGEVSVTYEFDLKRLGTADLITDANTMWLRIPGFFAQSLPCGVTEVRIQSANAGTVVIPDPDLPDDQQDVGGGLDLPTTRFTAPVLQCGSVIVVTISGAGANVSADVQILN